MAGKLIRMSFLLFVVLSPARFSFGRDVNKFPQIPMPTMPDNTFAESVPTAGVPSIGDLMTVIDKATTNDGEEKNWSTPVKLVIIFSILAILPSLLVMMTSFTRIVIVLAFVRRALTTQTIPPTIAVIGLALFLTLYTMAPTFARINTSSIQPYIADQIDLKTAATKGSYCFKEFMLRQSRESDLALFVQMAKIEPPASPMDIGMHIVIPAFIISEFRTAFEIGCL